MNDPWLRRSLRRLAPLLAMVVAGAPGCERLAEDAGSEAGGGPASAIERGEDGTSTLRLANEEVAAAGLESALPVARQVSATRLAYGTIALDPAHVTTLRAPFAGRLDARADFAWPELGTRVEGGRPFVDLLPRVAPLGPVERADLAARHAAARADEASAESALVVDRAALGRARTLNADDKGVSDAAVEAAAALVERDESARVAAHQAGELLAALLGAGGIAPAAEPLFTGPSGVVVAVAARPGELVEAGATLLQLADDAALVADVIVPSGAAATEFAPTAQLRASSTGDEWLAAELIGPAPAGAAVGRALRLRVSDRAGRLRPGDGVTARLVVAGAPIEVLEIAAAAVVRFGGRDWVFVEESPGCYVRRAVALMGDEAVGDGIAWARGGIAADARVVVVGAGLLLSHEQLALGGSAVEE